MDASQGEVDRRRNQAEADRQRECRTARLAKIGFVVAVLIALVATFSLSWALYEKNDAWKNVQAAVAAETAAVAAQKGEFQARVRETEHKDRAERQLTTEIEVVEDFLGPLPNLRDQGIRADQLKHILDKVVESEEKLRAA